MLVNYISYGLKPSRKLTVGFRSGGIRWNRESSGGIEVLGGKLSRARGGKQILRVTMIQLVYKIYIKNFSEEQQQQQQQQQQDPIPIIRLRLMGTRGGGLAVAGIKILIICTP